MKTQVVIIGAGPSGLLLSQLLNRQGIETLVLERSTREHVLARIRAGVLEWSTVDLLSEAGVGTRMMKQGLPHHGFVLADQDFQLRIDLQSLTGKSIMIYGQTEIQADLFAAQDAMGTRIVDSVEDVVIGAPASDAPWVEFTRNGKRERVDCLFIAGCDGFHGVSRKTIPHEVRKEYERVYPFGWLGILSQTRPASDEVLYSNSERGFALASMRSKRLVRYYVQVPLSDTVADWSDDRFWDEFHARIPADVAARLETGPSIEKSIAPLRSFVSEPMRWGRLLLVGDAAHIVPPTGAKGLNLAASDVFYAFEAIWSAIASRSETGLDAYSARALRRVWNAMRLSWQMTTMLHRFDGEDAFSAQMRKATLRGLERSEAARIDLAENYAGLPF